MPAPDLSAAERQAEALMIDACIIRRNQGGTVDDVVDHDTGQLVRPTGDLTIVYGAATTGRGGRSLAHPSGLGGLFLVGPAGAHRTGVDRLTDDTLDIQAGVIPVDAPDIASQDLVTVTHSQRDPTLVDTIYLVTSVVRRSMMVTRRLLLEERTHEPR